MNLDEWTDWVYHVIYMRKYRETTIKVNNKMHYYFSPVYSRHRIIMDTRADENEYVPIVMIDIRN